MHIPSISSLVFALLALSSIAEAAPKPADAIRLSQVKSLTLRDGAVTSHRRVSAISQLNCIGGAGCERCKVDIMRCKNAGSTYGPEDIQWTCTANLPPEFKLGSTDVICEGYDGPDDPYVLKGSCGVEYRLMLTEAGEEKYGKGGGWTGGGRDEEGLDFVSSLFWIAFLAVGGYIIWGIYTSWREQPRRARGQVGERGGWGGWGGGGPGGGPPFDDAPPPYPGYPGQKPTVPRQPAQGWQPGFWTGALGGAAAGWLTGNRGNRQERRGLFDRGGWGGNRGYGDGDGGGYGTDTGFRRSPGPSRSSSGGSTGARYESTGFGSTSRR